MKLSTYYILFQIIMWGEIAFGPTDGVYAPTGVYNKDLNEFFVTYPKMGNGNYEPTPTATVIDKEGNEKQAPFSFQSQIAATVAVPYATVASTYNPKTKQYASIYSDPSSTICRIWITDSENVSNISTGPTISDCKNPALAYDQQSGRYLIGWMDPTPGTQVFGRYYDNGWSQIDSDFLLWPAATHNYRISIVSNNKGGFFLSTFENSSSMYARFRLATDATDYNTNEDIDASAFKGTSVAYNSQDDEFMLVYSVSSSSDTKAQRFDSAGSKIGSSLLISSNPTLFDRPAIAYDPKTNTYRSISSGLATYAIEIKKFNADGTGVSSVTHSMPVMFGEDQSQPYIIANTQCGNFLALSMANSSGVSALHTEILGPDCQPQIEAVPTSLDFGEHEEGSTQSMTVVIKAKINDLEVQNVSLSGPHASSFKIVDDRCSGNKIDESDQCTIEIQFNSIVEGAVSASLVIPSDAENNSSLSVPLTAKGSGFEQIELLSPKDNATGISSKNLNLVWKGLTDPKAKYHRVWICKDDLKLECSSYLPNIGEK